MRRDRVAAEVEDPLEVAADEEAVGDRPERSERQRVANAVADHRRPDTFGLEEVLVRPEPVRAAGLGIGEVGGRLPGLDLGLPAKRNPMQAQPVVEAGAGAEGDRPRRQQPEMNPLRRQRLEVVGVGVEAEGPLDRDLDPLASLEDVDAHHRRFAGRYGVPISPRVLIAGATGFVGGRLARSFAGGETEVRALVRDPERAHDLESTAVELHVGDVTDEDSLAGAGEGVDVAYYLVHAMSGGAGFDERERLGARNFAQMAKREGVARVVYLGGLGEESQSEHLRSRHMTAEILRTYGPPLTYFRAAMVVGAGSESYRTLRYLVGRLPVMVAPSWLRTDTQPIGIEATIEYLRRAPEVSESEGREVQIGGPDILSYADMLDQMARAMGKEPRPKLPVPLLSPRLSSLWLGLVTPVDTKVARPLVEGLRTATIVTDPSGAALFGIRPETFDEALRRALAEEGSEPAR